MRNTKRYKLLISFTIIMAIAGSILGIAIEQFRVKPIDRVENSQELPVFTKEQLAKYNGVKPDMPIYLALDGWVYDVTPGKEYYQVNGSYHDLAGKDSSRELHIAGGGIIQKKYKIIGKYVN